MKWPGTGHQVLGVIATWVRIIIIIIIIRELLTSCGRA